VPSPHDETGTVLDNAFRLVIVMGGLLLVLLGINVLRPPTDELAAYLVAEPSAAPAIALTDPQGAPFSLDSLRGDPVLIFFGYTHCPDVCPATIGQVSQAMQSYGPSAKAVYVTVDPERDTVEWLAEYARYLPAGMIPLTGTADEIRVAADAWGVRYARVDTGSDDEYSMSHTADVYLVDATGRLSARFPFGIEAETIDAALRRVGGGGGQPMAPPASATPSPGPSVSPATAPTQSPPPATSDIAPLRAEVRSTSVWAGGASPVILALYDDSVRLAAEPRAARAQLLDAQGTTVGDPVDVVAVRQPGVAELSFVATVDIPDPGRWMLEVTVDDEARTLAGRAWLTALDPGTTAALGAPAPTVRTPTIDDVGVLRAITTDPAPDPRLSTRSTVDALAAGQPFVLVVDSPRFKVSPACGRAVTLARYFLDRWSDVSFIHLEPLRYSIVADTPVLEGSLDDPRLTPIAEAWGIGGDPWGARSMPWIFIVDADGIVRAKYQGVVGSADVDVILSLIAQGA
jgi:protein SCO1/2